MISFNELNLIIIFDFLDQAQIMDRASSGEDKLLDRRDKRTQVEQRARPAVDARCVAYLKQSGRSD